MKASELAIDLDTFLKDWTVWSAHSEIDMNISFQHLWTYPEKQLTVGGAVREDITLILIRSDCEKITEEQYSTLLHTMDQFSTPGWQLQDTNFENIMLPRRVRIPKSYTLQWANIEESYTGIATYFEGFRT